MSRIGKLPIPVPDAVTMTVAGSQVTITGPKGQLEQMLPGGVAVERRDGALVVTRAADDRAHRARHGLSRTLVANMVEGVTKGYTKVLEIYGIGFRAVVDGQKIVLSIGYSHPVEVLLPQSIGASVETFTPTTVNNYLVAKLTLTGIEKWLVGQVAARIRDQRKPEPFKGKGIRYAGERVRRKSGKAAAVAGAAGTGGAGGGK